MFTIEQRYGWVIKPFVLLAGLSPLVILAGGGFEVFGATLGADPVQEILRTLGKSALNFLLLTLTVTPLRQLLAWPQILRVRRMLGLFAFFYAALHFAAYIWLERASDITAVLEDVAERPYITIGFAALVLLVPLAVTSTNGMMRRLRRRWQTLHRLIYPIAILSVWHFYWQVKRDIREPLIYAGVLLLLLGYRLLRRSGRAATRRAGPAFGAAP